MGRMYAVSACMTAASGVATDLGEIKCATNKPVRVHATFLGQSQSTTTDQLRISIARVGASGTGGSQLTVYPLEVGEAAFSGSVYMNHAGASRGTPASIFHSEGFNALTGWVYMPTPEMRPTASPGGVLTFGLEDGPSASLAFSLTLYLEEIG